MKTFKDIRKPRQGKWTNIDNVSLFPTVAKVCAVVAGGAVVWTLINFIMM